MLQMVKYYPLQQFKSTTQTNRWLEVTNDHYHYLTSLSSSFRPPQLSITVDKKGLPLRS